MIIYSDRELKEQQQFLIKRRAALNLDEFEEKFLDNNLTQDIKSLSDKQKSTLTQIYLKYQWK